MILKGTVKSIILTKSIFIDRVALAKHGDNALVASVYPFVSLSVCSSSPVRGSAMPSAVQSKEDSSVQGVFMCVE